MSDLSPGQTIGPFFHHALPFPGDSELVPLGSPGSVLLHGTVFDGAGNPIPDALIEIRQSDSTGVIPEREGSFSRGRPFTGWGRAGTDRTGRFWFSTVEPVGFIAVVVFARGLLDRLFTRIYLPGATDPFLESLGDLKERLIATREPDGSLRFDIHLQGARESVFLTYPGHRS